MKNDWVLLMFCVPFWPGDVPIVWVFWVSAVSVCEKLCSVPSVFSV
jgi:hypothetical protein